MRPRLNRETGELLAWEYRPAGGFRGTLEVLSVDEVHTIVDPDFEAPDRSLEGLIPRHATSNAIAQFYKSDMSNHTRDDDPKSGPPPEDPAFIVSYRLSPSPRIKRPCSISRRQLPYA